MGILQDIVIDASTIQKAIDTVLQSWADALVVLIVNIILKHQEHHPSHPKIFHLASRYQTDIRQQKKRQ